MRDAFCKLGKVRCLFKDNSSLATRCFIAALQKFTGSVVFTRSFTIAAVCRIAGVRCIYELHELHLARNYTLLGGESKLLVVCISHSLEKKLLKAIDGVFIRTLVSHDGCDVEEVEKSMAAPPLQALENIRNKTNKKILLHTGSTYKFCAERFTEIASRLPSGWIFVQLGDAHDHIQTTYRDSEKIYLLPRCSHEDSLAAQQQADCLLYLNFPESRMYDVTSPLKLFEYIVSGRPFITTTGGATDEIINSLSVYISYENAYEFLNDFCSERLSTDFCHQAQAFKVKVSWLARARFILAQYRETFLVHSTS